MCVSLHQQACLSVGSAPVIQSLARSQRWSKLSGILEVSNIEGPARDLQPSWCAGPTFKLEDFAAAVAASKDVDAGKVMLEG